MHRNISILDQDRQPKFELSEDLLRLSPKKKNFGKFSNKRLGHILPEDQTPDDSPKKAKKMKTILKTKEVDDLELNFVGMDLKDFY